MIQIFGETLIHITNLKALLRDMPRNQTILQTINKKIQLANQFLFQLPILSSSMLAAPDTRFLWRVQMARPAHRSRPTTRVFTESPTLEMLCFFVGYMKDYVSYSEPNPYIDHGLSSCRFSKSLNVFSLLTKKGAKSPPKKS